MIKAWLDKSLNLFLPPLCSVCRKPVAETHKLCTDCWGKLNFISEPFCLRCGYPFEYEMGEESLCGLCLDHPPAYDHMRSVFVYEGVTKKLLMGFKHGDRTDFLPLLSHWLSKLYRDNRELHADILVPVPIHTTRLIKRRYNQAALLADALGNRLNVQTEMALLKRHRRTPPQKGNRVERSENVKKAFTVAERDLAILKGKTILIIDDVVTTGATIESCALVLKKAGAKKVKVLSLARVVL